MGKGAALEDISPAAPGGVAQPGRAVKGKPPQAAGVPPLDRPLPAVLSSRRRRGIYHQSPSLKERHARRGGGAREREKPWDKMSQGLLFPVSLFLRRGALRGLFLFPFGQQGHNLVFHFPGRGVLA